MDWIVGLWQNLNNLSRKNMNNILNWWPVTDEEWDELNYPIPTPKNN